MMNLKDLSFSKDWALFLDRDGVINHVIQDGYITRWEDFRFLDGALDALSGLSKIFGHIIIVSNQQGVGKGLMNEDDMTEIDNMMKKQVTLAGGRIDASFYSPHLDSDNNPDRKPGSGMAFRAKAKFPAIDFSRSVMVGDSRSDIEFGKRLSMVTVMIGKSKEDKSIMESADFHFKSLLDFAKKTKKILI
jgi:D-glycero-D-manno-heptose 1,7-bisphosphate phosphatase